MSVELDDSLIEEIKELPKIWVYRISLNSDKGGIIVDNWKDVLATLQDFIDEDEFSDRVNCSSEYFVQITREEMYLHEFEELGEFGGW